MAKGGDEGDEGRKGVPGGTRMPLVITVVVIAVVAVVYLAYYRDQVAYYTGRNQRLLSMLTAQIDGTVDMFAGFVGAKRDALSVGRGVDESASGWRLRLQAFTVPAGPPPEEDCEAVPLREVLRPIFARRMGGAFDVLLVADSAGRVLYSVRPPGNSSSLLYREGEGSDEREDRSSLLKRCDEAPARAAMGEEMASPVLTTLDAIERKTGWRGKPEALDLKALLRGTGHGYVTIDGEDYVLFTQPYAFARGPAVSAGLPGQWIVCGLVTASRFRYGVMAVSMNLVLLAIAIVLLAICCWPYLRIALIDPRQALTITDVVLIVICTVVGASVLTLMLLDVFAYRRIAAAADEQLKRFSEGVNDDFARNVGRGMEVLARLETTTAQYLPPFKAPLPSLAQIAADPVIGIYPYIDTLIWVDKDGTQQLKFSREASAPVRVAQRRYFKDALADRTWTVEEVREAPPARWKPKHDYVLEWVRSMSTGTVLAVLAKKTTKPEFPVIALGTELIDVSHAIAPPGVEMAIIDENGAVVYHTDAQRIGYENFFAEADQNRELRSAVVARRAGYVSATYWGEDQSLYVRPLNGSPWTLVTFRAKRVTRVLNIEGVLLTLMLLLLSGTPYIAGYAAVLIVAPSYRAPRLWPDPGRWDDYLRLCILLVACMALFRLNNYLLSPWSSFYGVLLIPAIAILTTYLALHRTGAARKLAVGRALWVAANAVLIVFFVTGDIEERAIGNALGRSLLVAAAVATAALTVLLLSGWNGGARTAKLVEQLRGRVGYATLYRTCGVLLLIVGVAMVVAGFFRISRHVETELLVKYGQLRAAADLEHRIAHLYAMSGMGDDSTASPAVLADLRYDRFATVFGSNWWLEPRPPRVGQMLPHEKVECALPGENWTIPPSAATWMPSLYEDSIAIRPLFEERSADDLWAWCLGPPFINLTRKVRFEPAVATGLWGKPGNGQSIVISSPLTQVALDGKLADAHDDTKRSLSQSVPAGPSGATPSPLKDLLQDKPRYYATMIFITLILLAAFWYSADFIATRVLLIDVGEPDWLSRLPLSPTLGDHIFLVRRDEKLDALTGPDPTGMGLPFLDVSFEQLDRANEWSAMLEHLDSNAAGRNVRVVDFEYGINDAAINDKKLQWLERLMELPDRTMIVVSTVSATYIRTTPPPPQALRGAVLWYYDRWRALLERFVWVTAEELALRHDARQRTSPAPAAPRTWLAKETEHNSFLRRLRGELRDTSDRKHLIDEIGERAETYYAGLWASCHDDDKLLLCNLAKNGLANGRHRRVLRRLIARGFVRREPNFQLFSETFRLFVLARARKEDIVKRSRELRGASTWDTLRAPFFVIIVSFLLLLFATQKDLLTTTTALATALTTGLPMIMKLIGAFTERRLDGPPRT
jgi:hypothetical protein